VAGAADALLAFDFPIKGLANPAQDMLGLMHLERWSTWIKDLDVPISAITGDGDHQGNPGPTVRTPQADHTRARDFIPGVGTMFWWWRCYIHHSS
jgi:hypothetical protein